MNYPNEFPLDSRARVDAAKVKAERDFVKAQQSVGPSLVPRKYQSAVEKLLKQYVTSVFFVFADEAIQIGRRGIWPASCIQTKVEEFGGNLISVAEGKCYYREGYIFDRTNAWDFRLEIWREIEGSERWLSFLDQVAEVADAQAAVAASNSIIPEKVTNRSAAQAIEESNMSPIQEPQGIPKLELIEPLLAVFVAQTIESIPSWIRANEGPHTGLIADFSNPPGATGRRSFPVRGVIARVVYRGTRVERLTVNSCCWLERSEQKIDFEPGEMHKLMLAVVTEGDETVFALANRRERIPVDGGYDPGIMPTPLDKLPFKAELVLIDDKGRTVFEAEFLLKRDKDKIITARKLEAARSDTDAAIGGDGTAQVVAENMVQLTRTVNNTAPMNADPAESKLLEPQESNRHDLDVPKIGVVEPKAKRGPKANMKLHHQIAEVVNSFGFGDNWKELSNLQRIAEKMDRRKIPALRAWEKRERIARTWRRALEFYPDVVRKALEYSLEMAAKDIPEKPSETLGNLR